MYAGYSSNLRQRMSYHRNGNTTNSSLCQKFASLADIDALGYIRDCRFRYVVCASALEAEAVEAYTIEQLDPRLNTRRPTYPIELQPQVELRYSELLTAPLYGDIEFNLVPPRPGVYLYYESLWQRKNFPMLAVV